MPDVRDGPRIPIDRFEAFVEGNAPVPVYDAGSRNSSIDRIARLVAAQIRAGDTVQLGLGKVQAAVLDALAGHHDLGFHAGMISGPMLGALEKGVFSRGVTTGIALGDPMFLRAVALRPDIRFRPVAHTHSMETLSGIEHMVSINSVIEVDLFGQANAETLGGEQVSGHGGLVDFVRGARASRGGRPILALPATARSGTISRIVLALDAHAPVSVARADVDIVVTEHGVAELRHAGMEQRAQRLIAIAAPEFRDELADAWDAMRRNRQAGGGAT